MSDQLESKQQEQFKRGRRDLMVAGVVAAVAMIGVALLAPPQHLWGVAVGAMIALANLSVLMRIGAELMGGRTPSPMVAVKAAGKVIALGVVVIAVLYTRPHLALGLCIGLALPAVAGVILAIRNTALREEVARRLGGNATED